MWSLLLRTLPLALLLAGPARAAEEPLEDELRRYLNGRDPGKWFSFLDGQGESDGSVDAFSTDVMNKVTVSLWTDDRYRYPQFYLYHSRMVACQPGGYTTPGPTSVKLKFWIEDQWQEVAFMRTCSENHNAIYTPLTGSEHRWLKAQIETRPALTFQSENAVQHRFYTDGFDKAEAYVQKIIERNQ